MTASFNVHNYSFPELRKIVLTFLLLWFSGGLIKASETADSLTREILDEVVVQGQSARQRIGDLKLGAEKLELSKLGAIPALFGERDIIKSISYLPGVHGEGDGSGGFEVRGGTSSQNLVLLDGISMYNPSHVMGIFSTFNDNAIGSATLFKGPIPATFGAATSSVLQTNLRAGDMESYHAVGTIGLLAAKLQAEGPIVRDKCSFAVTARRSYVDMFLQMVPKYRSTIMNFYDVTAKIRLKTKSEGFIDLSLMAGHDKMAIKDLMNMSWGNMGASLNWSTPIGESLHSTATAAFNNYSSDMGMTIMESSQDLKEFIRTISLNEKLVFSIDDNRNIGLGVRSELMRVKSAEFSFSDIHQKDIRSGWENAVWGDFEGKIIGPLYASAGIRLSIFSAMSGKGFHEFSNSDETPPDFSSRTYLTPEPRVSLKYEINERHNIKAGVSLTTQDLHSLRSNTTSFPFDRYTLSSVFVRPERAWQYGLGYSGMSTGGGFDWSVETYYKQLRNVYDYKDGRGMFSELNIENLILGGRGRSYGAEFMLRKNSGRLTGWIAYTLSKTQTQIPGINGGRWYDASNDRRNDISVVAIYNFNDRWSASASWIYSFGNPLTAPDAKYQLDGATCYYYSQRNSYRNPPTHRLDLSASYTHIGKKVTYMWTFGIYNAYCRYNPFVVYFEDDSTSPTGTRAVLRSMLGPVPSVSYTLKF